MTYTDSKYWKRGPFILSWSKDGGWAFGLGSIGIWRLSATDPVSVKIGPLFYMEGWKASFFRLRLVSAQQSWERRS